MMCLMQLGLLALGVTLMTRKQIRVGDQVARRPVPFFMGLALIMQMPAVVMIGFAVGVSEGIEAARDGKTAVDVQAIQAKWWWLDVAIPTVALAIAGVVLAYGLKDERDLPPERPHDGFLGVSHEPYASGHDDEEEDHRPRYTDANRLPQARRREDAPWDFKT